MCTDMCASMCADMYINMHMPAVAPGLSSLTKLRSISVLHHSCAASLFMMGKAFDVHGELERSVADMLARLPRLEELHAIFYPPASFWSVLGSRSPHTCLKELSLHFSDPAPRDVTAMVDGVRASLPALAELTLSLMNVRPAQPPIHGRPSLSPSPHACW